MKLANPRTDTSPNFKAFRSETTLTTTLPPDLSPVDHISSSQRIPLNKRAKFFSPVEIYHDKQNSNETKNYFSLGNTLNNELKTHYADCLDKWISRFSFSFTPDRNEVNVDQNRESFNIMNKKRSVLSYKCLEHMDNKYK